MSRECTRSSSCGVVALTSEEGGTSLTAWWNVIGGAEWQSPRVISIVSPGLCFDCFSGWSYQNG